MAEPSRDPKTTKSEPEKKQPETVLLTAEELRAIAGGQAATWRDRQRPPLRSQYRRYPQEQQALNST